MTRIRTNSLLVVVLAIATINTVLSATAAVLAARSSDQAGKAAAAALASCEASVRARINTNSFRVLQNIGWAEALNARIVGAAFSATPEERASNISAARVYHRIIMQSTYLGRPPCLDRVETDVVWRPPPPKPQLPEVPAR